MKTGLLKTVRVVSLYSGMAGYLLSDGGIDHPRGQLAGYPIYSIAAEACPT